MRLLPQVQHMNTLREMVAVPKKKRVRVLLPVSVRQAMASVVVWSSLMEARVAPVQVKSACSDKNSVRGHAVWVGRVCEKLRRGVEQPRKEWECNTKTT